MRHFKKIDAGFTLIELMIVVAIISILAAIAIPQYQTYVAKSQVSRVMSEAGSLRTSVEYCIGNGLTPLGTGASECNPGSGPSGLLTGGNSYFGTMPLNTGVPDVLPISVPTNVTVSATLGNSATQSISGSTVTWTRAIEGSWSCTSTALPKYRPAGC
jgi:type IV pilus assembly protein PilA